MKTTKKQQARIELAQKIGAEFRSLLKKHLTDDQWRKMIILNQTRTNPHVCHSHDFCDANQVMIDAVELATGEPFKIQMLGDNSIPWDMAWGKASLSNF